MPFQVTQRTGGDWFDLPSLAGPALVPSTSGVDDRHSVYSSPGSTEPEVSRRSSSPIVRVEVDYSNRLEVVWGEFAGNGLSGKLLDLLLARVRPSTQAAYQSVWSVWGD